MKYKINTLTAAFSIAILMMLFNSLILFSADADNTISLPGGTVTLVSGIVPSSISSNDLILVQFADDLSKKVRNELRSAGVNLKQYLGKHTYWVIANNSSALLKSRSVKAIATPDSIVKIDSRIHPRIKSKNSREIKIIASFFTDVAPEEAMDVLTGLGIREKSIQLLYGNRLEVSLKPEEILSLAKSNKLLAIELSTQRRRIFNLKAAEISRADIARNNFGLDGSGIAVGIWDGGPVFRHREFGNRVVIVQGGRVDDHATHVAGTIGARGLKRNSTGMAPNVRIVSYDYEGNVYQEMSNARKSRGIILSSNSWGGANGWDYGGPNWENMWSWFGNRNFGLYNSDSRSLDQLIRDTGLIVVFACGNDREDEGPRNGERYYDWDSDSFKRATKYDPDGPYHTIGEFSSAKNVIAVGALTRTAKMSSYSSWGPTDDGRVKPEITADGNLYSTMPNNRYGKMSGTSMAAPAVTGGLALVAQSWKDTVGTDLPVDVARALLAVTAIDKGKPGPDYQFGFGIMNVANMVKIIENAGVGDFGRATVTSSQRSRTFTLIVPAKTQTLKVSLAWVDPPAAPQAGTTIVNNLDVKLFSPGGQQQLPWKLDGKRPDKAATRGVNSVDNIELVSVGNPQSGTWKIVVTGTSFGGGGSQSFTVAALSNKKVVIR